MTLDEIRNMVVDSSAGDWKVLSADAPTYFHGFMEHRSEDEHWQELLQHDYRAVLRRDVDVGLVWGLTPRNEGEQEPEWTKSLQPSGVRAHVAEVLYRGQPVDRVLYASVDNAHGVVPWPGYLGGSDDPDAEPERCVSSRQLRLVELLKELGASVGVGSVKEYMRRCGITVAG